MVSNKANSLFDEWKLSLPARKRARENLGENFDDLFASLQNADINAAEVRELLPKAIKAHLPLPSVAKFTWNRVKRGPMFEGITQQEFIESWHQEIASAATQSMNSFYPPSEDTVYDSKMSSREYALQRSRADTFEMLDLDSINENNGETLSEEEMLNYLESKENV